MYVGCMSHGHIAQHSRDSRHWCAVEVERGGLFCFHCSDYVYHREISKLQDKAKQEAINKKRRREEATLAPFDQQLLRTYAVQHAPNDSILGLRGIHNLGNSCLPEVDTRVLTDCGFLFLKDIEARIKLGQEVLYACYDKSRQSIVYSRGELVLSAAPERWVDFTHAGTRRLWDATSDDYGSTAPANGGYANYLTLRTTPDHDMYVQLCTRCEEDGHESYEPCRAGGVPIPPHKQPARELAPGYQCECNAAGRTCTHGYSQYRMYTGAASGLLRPADAISLTNRDPRSPVAALGLRSKDELAAFLELFGYWLGNGTISYEICAGLTSNDAVCFAARKNRDRVYLHALLARLYLARGQHFTCNESDMQLEVRITEPRWFRYFDDEFGIACSNSRHYDSRLALLKQGRHSTQRRPSTASSASTPAIASSTRARSLSASVSVELVADYSGDEDDEDMSRESVEDEDTPVTSVKWLPDWSLFRLNAEQLRLVIEGLRQAAGGSVAAAAQQQLAAVGDKAMQNEHHICTSSVGFRDQLVHACVHAGYSAYFKLHSPADQEHGSEDQWCVCYSEVISEFLPAQDVRFDGSACRVRQQAAAIATQPADLYDQKRDGRVWCVNVEHADHLIFVQRAHSNASGVVTKVGRTMIVGNCYLSVILQHFIHNPLLRNFFLSDMHNKARCTNRTPASTTGRTDVCLACDVDDLFAAFYSGDHTPYGPQSILTSVWRHAEHLSGYKQQDAHELYMSMLDGLHQYTEQGAAARVAGQTGPGGVPVMCPCIIHTVYGGLLRSDVQCGTCQTVSTTHEPMFDISLDLSSVARSLPSTPTAVSSPAALSLVECLRRFTTAEKLWQHDQFLCRTCNAYSEATKQLSLHSLPMLLCIHFKRFEHHNAKQSNKIDTLISFPLTALDLAPYLHSALPTPLSPSIKGQQSAAAVADERRRAGASGGGAVYDLLSVVVHKGTLETGHYLCYLKCGGQWYRNDDKLVVKVSDAEVSSCQAYLLFYIRQQTPLQ